MTWVNGPSTHEYEGRNSDGSRRPALRKGPNEVRVHESVSKRRKKPQQGGGEGSGREGEPSFQ